MGIFSGSIEMSDSVIGDQDVTYSFRLSFQQQIEDDGKLVIRFPNDFIDRFSVTSCAGVSGLENKDNIECTYVPDVRILTISGCFPTTFTEIAFTVSGITNPSFAAMTNHFTVNSYRRSGSSWVPMESSGVTITVTPTAGALSGERLSLQDQIVGEYSTLTVGMTVSNRVPKDGHIEIKFPKWNSFETQTRFLESFVSTSTSPGVVPCAGVAGMEPTDLSCLFTQGETEDKLQVFLEGRLDSDIPAGTSILFTVDDVVRSPPSTSPVSGFLFQTTSVNEDIIDQSDATTNIQLQVSIPATGSALGTEVTSSDPSINI